MNNWMRRWLESHHIKCPVDGFKMVRVASKCFMRWGIAGVLALWCMGVAVASASPEFVVNIKHRWISSGELDPARVTYFTEQCVLHNLIDTLVRVDDRGQIQSSIAQRWRFLQEGRVVRFELGERQFSDGSRIGSHDVAASLTRLCVKKRNTHFPIWQYIEGCAQARAMQSTIAGIQTPAADVLELRLTQPVPDLLTKLAMNEMAIVPARAIDHKSLRIDWQVTAGAYVMKELSTDHLILEANTFSPRYSPDMPQRIRVQALQDERAIEQALVRGGIHMAWQRAIPGQSFAALTRRHIQVITRQFSYLGFLAMNPNSSELSNIAQRQAIRDRVFLAHVDFHSELYSRARGIFPAGLFGSTATWAQPDQVTLEGEIPLGLLVPAEYEEAKVAALSQLLRSVNITPAIERLPIDKMLERIRAGHFEAAMIVSGVSARYPDAFFRFNMDTRVLVDSDDSLPTLYQHMVSAVDDVAKQQAVANGVRYVIERGLLLPIWFERSPLFLQGAYQILSLPQFSESIPLWAIRHR